MKMKIKLVEPVKVYDIKNVKSPPIFELDAGTEAEMETVFKAWKMWAKITLPDGREGLIPGETKVQNFGVIAPKAGGWSNFVKVLKIRNHEQYGYDMMECIKEYEQEIVNHIQTDKDPADVILGCSRAGADWLLQEEVIKNNVINLLTKKSLKLDLSSIHALITLERVQKKPYVSDELIKLLVKKASETSNWNTYIGFVIDIAYARQDNQFVPEILNIYRAHGDDAIYFGGLSGLWKNSKDERIVDFLITQLERGFRVYDKYTDMSLSSLFVAKYKDGPAFSAAEQLLAIGEERGIREIVPHFLKFRVKHNSFTGEVGDWWVDWWVKHRETLNPYLRDGLKHEDEAIRNFAASSLKRLEMYKVDK